MRRMPVITIAVAALTAGPVAAASAKTISLRLDAYSPSTREYTPPVTSSTALKRGVLYVATAQGTFSFYSALDYTNPQPPFLKVCGRPLAAPLISSAGGTGNVGADPQFVFAALSKTPCTASQQKPHLWGNFEANAGAGWAHPLLAAARPLTRPNATHAYNYALVGRGKRVSFRILDTDVRDDYGAVQVAIRPASHSACAGSGYRAFRLRTRAACLARTVSSKAPATANLHPLTLTGSPVLHVLRSTDVPKSHNQEVPAGALTATQFARLITSSPASTPSITKTLVRDGFVSGAITEYAGGGLPDLTSTAGLYRNAASAQTAMQAELALDESEAPAGTSVSVAPAQSPAGAESITFTPATAAGVGGDEVVVQIGSFVYDLRAVEAPDAVSSGNTDALLSAVTGRFAAPAATAELSARLTFWP